MRRLTFALTGLALLAAATVQPAEAGRYASIVVDAGTGQVLHAESADESRYPASLTKMMTLYMTFDALKSGHLRLQQRLPVSTHAANQAPSSIGLKPGETITVEEAILATATKSANDAAVVLAEAIGGSEDAFGAAMTARARRLGMSESTFRNASGLPDPRQRTTARDMATLALALINHHGAYYHYFKTTEFTWKQRSYTNHNHLLANYDGADGIKTGYIRASGFNLVASAQRDGRRLIGVVFGGNTAAARDKHMAELLDRGFGGGLEGETQQARLRLPSLIGRAEAATLATAGTSALGRAVKPAGGAWTVQLGAFSDRRVAHKQIDRAIAAAPTLLSEHEVVIVPGQSKGTTSYRTRLTGFDKTEARAACRELQRKNLACVVVAPPAS